MGGRKPLIPASTAYRVRVRRRRIVHTAPITVNADNPTGPNLALRINRVMVSLARRWGCASPDAASRLRSGCFRAQFHPAAQAE